MLDLGGVVAEMHADVGWNGMGWDGRSDLPRADFGGGSTRFRLGKVSLFWTDWAGFFFRMEAHTSLFGRAQENATMNAAGKPSTMG